MYWLHESQPKPTWRFSVEHREALTIRFPATLLAEAREMKKERESLNDIVVDALEDAVRRRRGLEVFDEIQRAREEIRAEHGIHPDSGPLIRSLRDGTWRGD